MGVFDRLQERLTVRGRTVPVGGILLVLVAYVPLLLTKPGKVGADTKTYLYLDPARLLSRAAYMWDTNIGLGTVTHQNIGYLWPMGPYYWLMDRVGFPDWVAQRLWLGSIIVAAGLGLRWMLKELRWQGAGVTVASFAYALSPYLLHYSARISVILLPFAGLPWLIGLASRSLRVGGWRAPALFALVTLTVGGVNATSLLLVMAAPVLWMVHATFVSREVTWKRALAAGLRISVLTLITSFWWMAGLLTQGTYGIPILRYTETYSVVANAALAPELLRGLGYWFIYGRDGLGPWIQPVATMIQNVPALALSYLLPVLAFASAVLTRFRHRGYFALLALVGLVLAVAGRAVGTIPSPAGAVFWEWSRTDSGLAFRSTPRAVPLIALALAVFLGAGTAALTRWRPSWHLPVAGGLLVLICANQSALFVGQMVDRNVRDEHIPGYWDKAATYLQSGNHDYRVYEMPGSDFAYYRWGNTIDPVTPGLMDRDYAARELIPYGAPGSANLLNQWDLPLQQGTSDPATIAPIARLLGVNQIIHRADLQYERYRTPRPRLTYAELQAAPGLGTPTGFGPATPNTPVTELPLQDEVEYGTPNTDADPPPVSVFPVEDPRPMLRSVQASAPVVMSGDAAGLVSLAAAGALQADRPVLSTASFVEDPKALARAVAEPDASLVVTDTNRRQARHWGSVRENDGHTEQAGERPLTGDPADNRLDLFPGAGDDAATVSEQRGDAVAQASKSNFSYTPTERAAHAIDGDPSTAWRIGAFEPVEGAYLDLRFRTPVTTDRITLLQSQRPGNRWMTGVSLAFGDHGAVAGRPADVALTDASRTVPGQVITFPKRTFDRLRITITDTNRGRLPLYTGVSDVGIAEVTIPGVDPTTEVIRPPTDLLAAAGPSSLSKPLTYLFNRRSANPAEVLVEDEERSMRRWVEGPVARNFIPYGKARLSAQVPDQRIDDLIGLPSAAQGGLTASSQAHLAGDLRSRAASAVDGDPATAWQTPINGAVGDSVQVQYPGPLSFDRLPVTFVADGRHSIPTRLRLEVDGRPGPVLDLGHPGRGSGRARGATTTVDVPTGPVTGTTFRFTIDAVDPVNSKDWSSGSTTVVPVGIAELGLPVTRPQQPAATPFPATCRDDLVQIGGAPVPLRVVGTVGDALSRSLLRLESCVGPTRVEAGRTLLASVPGRTSGIDVDLLALSSAAGGGPGIDTLADPPGPGPTPPATTTSRPARLTYQAKVTDATEPYWVVLGQSLSPGWHATADGKDLGAPTLVNGYANGWRVDPKVVGRNASITLTWTPQRTVWIALLASLVGVLVCLGLAIRPTRFLAGTPVDRSLVPVMDVHGIGPLATDGATLPVRMALLAAAVVGLATVVFMGPVVGLATAVLTAVALAAPRGQVALRVMSVGALAIAALYIVGKQALDPVVVNPLWMNQFEFAHGWGLLATALLALDPLVEALRRRRTAPSTE